MKQQSPMPRRAFIKGGAAALTSLLVGTSALAQAPFAVRPVDRLALQAIVDNATFGPFLPDLDLPGMRVERAGRGGPGPMPRIPLLAEFGLSILARSSVGEEIRHVLVDFGYSQEVLANNLALLGVDPDRLDASVLSHGHLDHYGGFRGLFERSPERARPLPLIVGGEETFCERVATFGSPPPVMGLLDKAALAQAGLEVRIASEPILVADHAFTTGSIPLAGFEQAAMPTAMRPGVGCERSSLSPAKRQAAEFPDDGEHELATCYAVKGLGLVVIASCSHRGVLNSVRRAQAVSGIEAVHAVVGGFHLVRPRTPEDVRATVAGFVEMNPRYVVPMHCSGEAFISAAEQAMPGRIVRPYVGSSFVFEA